MIICGRDLSAELLQRLEQQAASLSLRALGRWLCDTLGLVGPSGQPQVSVAVQMLRALIKRGILSLVGRPVPSCSRAPRPACCEAATPSPACFEGSLAELGPVELVQVPSRWSRDYRRWRGLLQTHHYLGAGPLCGHQLRYLIKSAHGDLGAAAFSAAARRVAGRDQWIGWGDKARRENLHLVVSQSRFLIVPSVKVPHLASHVLAQMTARLAADWQANYAYGPVLLESFVELGRYPGTCYQAANWQAIGLTAGRGRQDAAHEAALPPKVLLVYPLQKDFRQVLCREPQRPRLVDRSGPPPAPPPAPATWQQEEFGGVALGDERLVRRLHTIAGDFFARPTMNIPQACGSRAKVKAVYRFLDHPRVHLDSVLSGHYRATGRRAAAYPVVLAVQDTTELNYSTHRACEMLGPVGDRQSQAVGLWVHDTMVYNLEGTPLGLIDVQCWARDPEDRGKSQRRYELPIGQKESGKWLVSYGAAARLQAECAGTMVVSVGDREADLYELFVEARALEGQAQVLVRATRERKLEGEDQAEDRDLWAYVRGLPVEGGVELKVPRRGACSARTAALEIRFAAVELKAPKRKPGLGSVRLWAIAAEEVGAPAGVEPIRWYLLTTLPVESLEQAVEKLRWYALRFQIEVYHRTLKSGCKIEERQLGHADRIEACLGIDLVVAWRIAHLTKLGREVPEVPCTVYFEEAQWQALVVFVTERPPPAQPPTLREAVRMVATRLGGFLGRKSDGEPGAQCLWRGLQRLDDITQMWCAVRGEVWVRPTEAELGEDSS
jgi:hypothetical protein